MANKAQKSKEGFANKKRRHECLANTLISQGLLCCLSNIIIVLVFADRAICWGAMAGAIDIKLEAKACCCQHFMLLQYYSLILPSTYACRQRLCAVYMMLCYKHQIVCI